MEQGQGERRDPLGGRDGANVLAFPSPVVPCGQEADVERINQFAFYELGNALAQIASYTGTVHPSAAVWDLWAAQRQINTLLGHKVMQLGVSRSAAEAVKRSLDQIDAEYFRAKDDDGKEIIQFPDSNSDPIPEWRFNYLRNTIKTFETVFSAEMAQATAYFVPRRGIFSTPDLIDYADKSFPESVQPHIPEKAKTEWRAAGRCLAFNLLSASGFHVARAVEAVLEVYYQLYTAKTGTLNGWYDYIKTLQAIVDSGAKPAPAEKTLAELMQMKDDYRNPVMHPRVSLNDAEARMLFDNGESLIIGMASEIATIKTQGGAQGALTIVTSAQATT